MSLKLSEIVSGERTVPVTIGNAELSIRYHMSETTPHARLNDSDTDPWLVRVLAGWDLTDDDGVVLPIDIEHLVLVPGAVLRAIRTAILEDDALGEAEEPSVSG